MSLEFPFEYVELGKLGKLFYPVVRLKLKTIAGWREFEFLVDTGADVTTVPSHLLPVLGLRKSELQLSSSLGVGGFSVTTWDFRLQLKFGKIELLAAASAVDAQDESLALLLGRKDIFENRFNLFIDSRRKLTVISNNI